METFTTPDTQWLHGVKHGTEYCLGRPSCMKLHFCEEIGFALEQFLPAITDDYAILRETMWNFANGVPVPLKDRRIRALVHLLKRICDLRKAEYDYETAARAADTHEIFVLNSLLGITCEEAR